MNIVLKAGERIYINGAVIRVDRKSTLELMNEAAFLVEAQVMQAAEATTPLRQIYFAIQIMLMDPLAAGKTSPLAISLVEKAGRAFESPEIRNSLITVGRLIEVGRYYEAMKSLRELYAMEHREMFPSAETAPSQAA